MAATGRARDERGASALEMSFIAPSLILLIFFTIQGSLYFYGRTVAVQSAREGASLLRLATDEPTYEQIKPAVQGNTKIFASQVGREALIDPDVETQYFPDRGRVSVRVSGRVISLVPGLQLRVSEVAYGPVERFEEARPSWPG